MNKKIFFATCAAILLLVAGVQAHQGEDGKATTQIGGSSLQLIANNGQLTDQDGQLRPDIDAKAEQGGVTMFVGDGQLHYQWVRSQKQKEKSKNDKEKEVGFVEDSLVSIYRMDVTLVGADRNVVPVFEEATGYYENYYLAHTGEDGVQAKGYGRVVYKNVYKGIDWVIYVENSKFKIQNSKENINAGAVLKYDFIVHPGGDVGDIRLRYDGATELRMENGAMVAVTPYGSITEAAPYSYVQGTKTEVASNYILEGNELRFATGSYSGTLVIDPELKWGTYFGTATSSGRVYNSGIATDTGGNTYLSANAVLAGLATTGAYQDTFAGSKSVLLVKFDSSGKRQWSTYFGQYSEDAGVACDRLNGVYIGGSTIDTNIGTPNTYQPDFPGQSTHHIYRGGKKAFVAKFNSTGQREWCTYYGDSVHSWMQRIISDSAGNVAILVHAYADGVHTHKYSTSGAFVQTASFHGSAVAKFNTKGQRIWGSPLHGRALASDYVSDIAYDDAGNLYLTGGAGTFAEDTVFVTSGTHQSTHAGQGDAFLLKLGNVGQKLWGTFYGGASGDGGAALATDRNSVFVLGHTNSSTGIATSGAIQTTLIGADDDFIAKFDGNNGKLNWGTYYDGGNVRMQSIGVNIAGEIFTLGTTSSSTGVSTANALQPVHGGGVDMVIMRLTNDGKKRKWATYYGGSGDDALYSYGYGAYLTCYKKNIFISGNTNSTSKIATANTHQPSLASGMHSMFVAKIYLPDTLVYITRQFADTIACAGDTLYLPYEVTANFASNNQFKVLLSNSSGSFASPTALATVSNNKAGTIACYLPTGLSAGKGYRVKITASSPVDSSADNSFDIRIGKYPAAATASASKTPMCTADTLLLKSSSTTNGVTYSWTGPNSLSANTADVTINNPSLAASGNYYITIDNKGCMFKDTLAIQVNQSPENVVANNNGPVCTGDNLQLSSSSTTSGVTYAWSGPGSYNTQNVSIPNALKNQGGVYTVTVTLGNCTTTATTNATIEQGPQINIVPTGGTEFCVGETAQFLGFANFSGTNPQFQWQVNGVDVSGATNNSFQSSTLNNGDKVRLKVTPNSSCPGVRFSNEIVMTIATPKAPSVTITADKMPPWNNNILVSFTAVAVNAHSGIGVPPEYQWRINGKDVGGAIGDVWGASTSMLNENDVVCVRIKSNYECPKPVDTALSNCINAQFTGVGDLNGTSQIKVYPNPVGDVLHITSPGLSKGEELIIELYDVVGRKMPVVYSNGSINMSGLPAGNYVLQVQMEGGAREYFKLVKE